MNAHKRLIFLILFHLLAAGGLAEGTSEIREEINHLQRMAEDFAEQGFSWFRNAAPIQRQFLVRVNALRADISSPTLDTVASSEIERLKVSFNDLLIMASRSVGRTGLFSLRRERLLSLESLPRTERFFLLDISIPTLREAIRNLVSRILDPLNPEIIRLRYRWELSKPHRSHMFAVVMQWAVLTAKDDIEAIANYSQALLILERLATLDIEMFYRQHFSNRDVHLISVRAMTGYQAAVGTPESVGSGRSVEDDGAFASASDCRALLAKSLSDKIQADRL